MSVEPVSLPYVGITDFTDFSQVERMLKCFNICNPARSIRTLHVGVMMSYKTLNDMPTKWSKVFPPKEKIASIFGSDDVYNCLHYADYDADPELTESLVKAISYGGIGIQALQLDMVWPDPVAIDNARHISRKPVEIILQINKKALELVQNNPNDLVEKLADYRNVIQRVLLDKSMGRGQPLNAEELLPYARAIHKHYPNIQLGVAGGLGPGTVHLIKPLFEEFPYVSIDAQGRLRPTGNALEEPINLDMAEAYLIEALSILP